MKDVIETVEHKGHTINIYYDEHSESPLEWDNLGKFICFHNHCDLGHKHDFTSPNEVVSYAKETGALLYPLYLYDHSGLNISLSPFSCPWDSGQVGYVLVKKEDAIKEFGKKIFTKQVRNKVLKRIQSEVQTYDQYLTGEIYGYVIGEDENNEESCWGFYGQEYCVSEAKSSIDCIAEPSVC